MGIRKVKDFDKLKYNPFKVTREKRMWQVYDDFAKRPLLSQVPTEGTAMENFSGKDLDKLLKYMVLFIDPLSPFAGERDFTIRERLVLEALDYKPNQLFIREIKAQSSYFVDVMMEYFQMIHNINYEYWFTTVQSFRMLSEQLLTGQIKISDRKSAMELQSKLVEKIKVIEHQLFPDEMTKKLLADKATQGLKGYAEKYALELEENY
jgi:hypothetical protein